MQLPRVPRNKIISDQCFNFSINYIGSLAPGPDGFDIEAKNTLDKKIYLFGVKNLTMRYLDLLNNFGLAIPEGGTNTGVFFEATRYRIVGIDDVGTLHVFEINGGNPQQSFEWLNYNPGRIVHTAITFDQKNIYSGSLDIFRFTPFQKEFKPRSLSYADYIVLNDFEQYTININESYPVSNNNVVFMTFPGNVDKIQMRLFWEYDPGLSPLRNP